MAFSDESFEIWVAVVLFLLGEHLGYLRAGTGEAISWFGKGKGVAVGKPAGINGIEGITKGAGRGDRHDEREG